METKKLNTQEKLNKFIGIVRRSNLPKEEIVRTLETISREISEVTIDSWKGKSSFEVEELGEILIVTKYQKPERGAEPKAIKTRIKVRELKRLEILIKLIIDYTGVVKSRYLGEEFYNMRWDDIFSNRPLHNKFTIMLNVLEKKEVIEYKGGNIKLK